MIDINPPNWYPQIGVMATLAAAAPTAVTNTIAPNSQLRKHNSEMIVAKTIAGTSKLRYEPLNCWSM